MGAISAPPRLPDGTRGAAGEFFPIGPPAPAAHQVEDFLQDREAQLLVELQPPADILPTVGPEERPAPVTVLGEGAAITEIIIVLG